MFGAHQLIEVFISRGHPFNHPIDDFDVFRSRRGTSRITGDYGPAAVYTRR
jgi:hypothetical protein